MKKTLLATAIAGAMVYGATSAQAATVYDQDGSRLDVYGRIAVGVAGGGPEYDTVNGVDVRRDNGVEFVDVYSRLGLRGQQQINSDLSAFAHVEWRFRGDERTGGGRTGENDFSGFSETRQSYIGLRSASFGTVQAGNYDSFYNMFVSSPFDVYIDRGLEFAAHPTQARGDSIGYYTPDLGGFQAFLSAKHYSGRGDIVDTAGGNTTDPDAPGYIEMGDGDSETATQGGVKYEVGGLRLALGYVDDVVEGGGNDEVLYGATVGYAFNDDFSARLGYETRDHNEDIPARPGYDTWGLGMTYAMGQWAFNADVYRVSPENDDNRTAWALGSYYKISSNFDVFLELHQADQPDIDITIGGDPDVTTADGDDMYWLTGARYHF